MRIKLLLSGKNSPSYINDGCNLYEKRLGHYVTFKTIFLPEIKLTRSMTSQQLKNAESDIFIKGIKDSRPVFLLDEGGKKFSSKEFSTFIENFSNLGQHELIFAIGGAHGFNDLIKKHVDGSISLSNFTLPHQLARLVFYEQLYRAFTIIKKEPYHHA